MQTIKLYNLMQDLYAPWTMASLLNGFVFSVFILCPRRWLTSRSVFHLNSETIMFSETWLMELYTCGHASRDVSESFSLCASRHRQFCCVCIHLPAVTGSQLGVGVTRCLEERRAVKESFFNSVYYYALRERRSGLCAPLMFCAFRVMLKQLVIHLAYRYSN